MSQQYDFSWDPWEVDKLAPLRSYLERNSMDMSRSSGIVNGDSKKEIKPLIGSEVTYSLYNGLRVHFQEYHNGSGKLCIVGEKAEVIDKESIELKQRLGFKKLR